MKMTLLSAAAVSGFAALTIGLAAPAIAAPMTTATGPSSETAILSASQFASGPRYFASDDGYPYSDFGTVRHPYYDSLLPRPSGSPGVTPGQSPGQVPLGPIIGRR